MPDPSFDKEMRCEDLRKAMKGKGTDKQAIIISLTTCSADQRQQLKIQYKTMYSKVSSSVG